jgi:hypothetical protein
MASWSLQYGGFVVMEGLNDNAKDQLALIISEAVSSGQTGWFVGGNPDGPGVFEVYLTPGVSFAFVSKDAFIQKTAPAEEAGTVRLG